MLKNLCPDYYVDSVFLIDWNFLLNRGINGLVFDLDNTLTHWNSDLIEAKTEELLEQLKGMGFRICLISNNSEDRVQRVAKFLRIPYVARAGKPKTRGYLACAHIIQTDIGHMAAIGDQVFTDVLGARRAGVYTILVKPLGGKEFWGTKISRCLEFFVLPFIRRKLAPPTIDI